MVDTKRGIFDVEIATTEQQEHYSLQDPIVQEHLLKGYPKAKLQEAMHREMNFMSDLPIADVVPSSALTEDPRSKALDFTWVHRWKRLGDW